MKLFNSKKTCASTTTPEFPTYVIGTPSKDQLLQLPTQTINTGAGGFALSNIGYDPIKVSPMLGIHVNSIKLFNSNLVLSYAGSENMARLGGTTDNTNEFSAYKAKNFTPIQDVAKEYNKWPVLNDMPKKVGQWPCKTPSLNWGRDGVPICGKTQKIGDDMKAVDDNSDNKFSEKCNGMRSSVKDMPLQPQHWPTLGGLPRNSGENWWLFDGLSGVPAFVNHTRG